MSIGTPILELCIPGICFPRGYLYSMRGTTEARLMRGYVALEGLERMC